MIHYWRLIVLTFLLGCGQRMANEIGPLGLSGTEYWNDPLFHTSDKSDKMMNEQKEEMVIDAPGKVFLDSHTTIPLVCLRSLNKEFYRFRLKTTTQLIVTHLETGKIRCTKLGLSPARIESPPSPGWMVEDILVDLNEIMDLSPSLGHYDAWIVCGPEASNQRGFQIYPSKEAENRKETIRALMELRAIPSLDEPKNQPPRIDLINSIDMDFKADETVWKLTQEKDEKGKARLRLKFKIKGLPRFNFPKDKPIIDASGKRVFASLPIHLVGFDEDRTLIISERVNIPIINNPSGDNERPWFSGNVAIALKPLLNPNQKPKLLSFWAICMNHRDFQEIKLEDK